MSIGTSLRWVHKRKRIAKRRAPERMAVPIDAVVDRIIGLLIAATPLEPSPAAPAAPAAPPSPPQPRLVKTIRMRRDEHGNLVGDVFEERK